jgi:hypothetical protein
VIFGGDGNDTKSTGSGTDLVEGGLGTDSLSSDSYDTLIQEQGSCLVGLAQVFQDFDACYDLDTFYYTDPANPVDDRPARVWVEDFLAEVVGNPLDNLQALGEALPGATAEALSKAQLQSVVDAAVERWMDSGFITAEQLSRLSDVTIEIVDLEGDLLGQTDGNVIRIDYNAAGFGWFVDATPEDDVEFAIARTDGSQAANAWSKMDLLSVVSH